ncbi:MAG: helix-turn-helix transcriptional regulator [Bacteroidota bacterium]|nr:helix-turn-helix transcriptional regulator [Bacteroidota bacterium]
MKKRLKKWMLENKLNANQFALRINVNRSTITHILSGRNNPSVDFLDKLIRSFPEINSNWLISGVGDMYIESINKPKINKVVIFYDNQSFDELEP